MKLRKRYLWRALKFQINIRRWGRNLIWHTMKNYNVFIHDVKNLYAKNGLSKYVPLYLTSLIVDIFTYLGGSLPHRCLLSKFVPQNIRICMYCLYKNGWMLGYNGATAFMAILRQTLQYCRNKFKDNVWLNSWLHICHTTKIRLSGTHSAKHSLRQISLSAISHIYFLIIEIIM